MCFLDLFRKKKPKPIPQTGTGDDMLIVNNLNGFGAGGGSLSLVQKGYGYIEGAGITSDLALSYGNVSSGSAPSAGDLVAWIVYAIDTSSQAIADLTGSGWTQDRRYVSTTLGSSILAKVVAAGDIASPPTAVSAPTNGSAAMWIAYTISGSVTSLAISGHDSQYAGASAPSSDAQDSTALTDSQYAITMCFGAGNDTNGVTVSWSGATPDIRLDRENIFSTTTDIEYTAKLGLGGDSVTITMGDEGSTNSLASGYIAVA